MKNIKNKPLLNLDFLDIKKTKVLDTLKSTKNISDQVYNTINKISQMDGVIIGVETQGNIYSATHLKPSQNRKLQMNFPEPNPVVLFYQTAISNLQKGKELKKKLLSKERLLDYNFYNDNYCDFFKHNSSGVIFLTMTIESFINQLLPETHNDRAKSEMEYDRLKDKISDLVQGITKIDFKKTNHEDYNRLCDLIELRNDLVHLKKASKENLTFYQSLMKRVLDFDCDKMANAVFEYVNTIIPQYFEEI